MAKDKWEIRQEEQIQLETTESFVAGILYTEGYSRDKIIEIKNQMKAIKDRLTFQDTISEYMAKIDYYRVFGYTLGKTTYKSMTNEKDWKDYRGHIIYLISELENYNIDEGIVKIQKEYSDSYINQEITTAFAMYKLCTLVK